MPGQSNQPAAHTRCHICSQLADVESAYQKYGRAEDNTYLPTASNRLLVVKDFKPNASRKLELQQCPECQTYYLYRTDYEFLVNGSEDEEELTRLTDAEAVEYLERPTLVLQRGVESS
jgi:hypothetical protein